MKTGIKITIGVLVIGIVALVWYYLKSTGNTINNSTIDIKKPLTQSNIDKLNQDRVDALDAITGRG